MPALAEQVDKWTRPDHPRRGSCHPLHPNTEQYRPASISATSSTSEALADDIYHRPIYRDTDVTYRGTSASHEQNKTRYRPGGR